MIHALLWSIGWHLGAYALPVIVGGVLVLWAHSRIRRLTRHMGGRR